MYRFLSVAHGRACQSQCSENTGLRVSGTRFAWLITLSQKLHEEQRFGNCPAALGRPSNSVTLERSLPWYASDGTTDARQSPQPHYADDRVPAFTPWSMVSMVYRRSELQETDNERSPINPARPVSSHGLEALSDFARFYSSFDITPTRVPDGGRPSVRLRRDASGSHASIRERLEEHARCIRK